MSFKGGNDKNAFQTYINQVLVPKLWEGACVVMDNFSSHKVAGIREAIESVGAHLIYLSPYSPDFSQEQEFLVKNQRIFTLPLLLALTPIWIKQLQKLLKLLI